ncbi:MAG: choice-of-anchor Q domain-containing protein [Myxococcota bacterium]
MTNPTRLLALGMLCLFALLVLGGSESAAAVLFVRSTDGSDAGNTCLVEASPCRTIQHAYDAAGVGDEIWIAGDFDESVRTTFPVSFLGRSRFVLPFSGASFGTCVGETGINRCPLWTTASTSSPALELDPGGLQTSRVEDVRFADVTGPPAVRIESGSITLRGARFRDNVYSLSNRGAALSVQSGAEATIETSIFENNRSSSTSSLSSGAISSEGVLWIFDSSFTLNSAEEGGAVNVAGSLRVTNSDFDRNFAAVRGGAISALNSPVTLIDDRFLANETNGAGGAVSASSGTLDVQGSTLFEGNRADIDPASSDGGGGAILVVAQRTNIDGATFRANVVTSTTSEAAGAAIASVLGGTTTIRNTLFEENEDAALGSSQEAGILGASDGVEVVVESSVFSNAGTHTGGTAIVVDASTLTMRDSEIRDYASGIFLETISGNALPSSLEVLRSTLAAHTTNLSSRTGTNTQIHDVRFFNSTLSGATAENVNVGEAGIYTFDFTTLAEGRAFDFGAFTGTSTLQVTLRDSIVDGDCAFDASPFVGPTLAFGTRWSDPSCGIGPGFFANLGLLPLADNGGPTETHALVPTSPAVDAGGLRCLSAPIDAIDQRGFARPEGACDAGAVEVPEPGFGIGLALAGLGRSLGRRSPRSRSRR